MRTTIRLRDDLLKPAKKRAAEENRTLTSLVEEGVALVLSGPGVDLNRSADLEAQMEDE
jgi:hypothetical protein